MKMIQAVIRPERFENVKAALEGEGFVALTAFEVRGRGEQKGITLEYRGKPVNVDMLPKMLVEVVVKERDLERAIACIQKAARTGRMGDGKIFVLPVERVIRIRTGEEWSAD